MKNRRSFSLLPARFARVLVGLSLAALAGGGLASRAAAADYNVTTTSLTNIVVTDAAGNGDTLDVTEPSAGNIRFAAAGRTFSVNGGAPISGDSGILSRAGLKQIIINAAGGDDAISVGAFTGSLPSLTINGGVGNDTVNFNGSITFNPDAHLDVDLQNDDPTPGTDAVNVSANVLASGTGAITVKCSRNVGVNSGTSLQTVNGNLTVEANQQVVPTPGDFAGVVIDGLVRSTGAGQVAVRGRGGDGAGGGQLGVLVVFGGQIIGGTSGAVTVLGTGGASTNWINRGVTVYGAGALVSSLGGPVQVTGLSGSVGSDYGIGVALLYGGVISAGGTGTVTVDGTGAGFGGANQGIEMGVDGSAITSSGGSIQVTGTAGPGDSYGIIASASVGFTNLAAGGSITLISDSILIETSVGVVASGAGGSVTIKPRSNGTLIELGGADIAGTLGLTDEELDFITTAALVIGGTNAGSITVSAPISPANAGALSLISGGTIGDNYSVGTDVIVASLTTRGNLAPGASPGVFNVTGNETLAAGSTFTVEIGGVTAGTQHDQLSATGSVTIGTNVTLNLVAFGGFVPGSGPITIISRTGGSGTFAGLPQGATLANFLGSGRNAIISYTGGTGDDVVLTMLGPEIVVEQPAGAALEDRMTIDQYAATVIDFSSAYGGPVGDWGANQVLGEPDTFDYGDIPTAWASSSIDQTLEFITVGFATPVHATGATVRETSANGFVYQIDALDTNDVLHTVWTGTDPSLPGSPANFLITWTPTPYLVKGLKVYVNTDQVPGEWEEIDSIQLHGIGNSLVDFGPVNLGSSSNLTFTIRNTGNANLTGLGITIDGADAGDFAVTASPTAPVSGPSGSTTFTVTFTPAADGARGAALHIASNDSDENPFDIELVGRGPVPPSILVQPAGTNAPPGANVTLCVTASGTPLFYQWRRNGVNIPGANAACLTLVGAQARDGGAYDVVVYNSANAILSDPAAVVITVPLLPPGDNLANRVPLPGATGTVRASNVNATRETNEPMHVGKPGGASVWYSFTSGVAGIMSIDTAGSTFDTLLAVYTGATIPALVEVAGDEESGGALTSEVRFNVAPGVQYDIVVDGHGGVMGDFVLSWQFTPTAQLYPVILVQPASATVPPGANHTFTASVSGSGLTYQWFFNGNPVPGATTNSLTRTNIQESSLGTYMLRVTQGARSLDSRPASLQINLTGGSAQPVQATDKFLDADVLSRPIVLGGSAELLRPLAPAGLSRGYTGTQVFSTFGAVSTTGEPPICGVQGGASEWIKILAEESGELHLNTDGSSFNTVIAAYERIPGVAALHSLGCDNNSGLDGLDSALVVPVVAGRTNYIVIDGVNGATGVLKLNYNLVVPSLLIALGPDLSGQYRFQIIGRPGMAFTIQYTSDFTTWMVLFSGTDADGSHLFTDTSPAAPAGRFYRLLMRP